jgi:hypothetical protein
VRGSNAIQWQMIRDAAAAGCAHVYDLRGITDTLKSDDPHIGLIQFKTGTGGEAVEYVGEWDLPLNRRPLQSLRHLHEEALMSLTLHIDEAALAGQSGQLRFSLERWRPGAGREGQWLRPRD